MTLDEIRDLVRTYESALTSACHDMSGPEAQREASSARAALLREVERVVRERDEARARAERAESALAAMRAAPPDAMRAALRCIGGLACYRDGVGSIHTLAGKLDAIAVQVSAALAPAPPAATPDAKSYGKDCPPGMVQVEFVGCSPSLRYSEYGWRPAPSAFLEVYVDGKRFRIDVGDFHDGRAQRRGLRIVTDLCVAFEQTSLNAASVYLVPAPPAALRTDPEKTP